MYIKETPVRLNEYWQLMKEHYTKLCADAVKEESKLSKKIKVDHAEIKSNLDVYKDKFKINLLDYSEFVDNNYTTGDFYKAAKTLFINRRNNYELIADIFDIYNLAINQKKINNLRKQINLYRKCIKLNYKSYCNIFKTYYSEVNKLIILKGYGYTCGYGSGCICINRIYNSKNRNYLDIQATLKRKKELQKAGAKLYNKEEADWCAKYGYDYKYEPCAVYKSTEYYYEYVYFGAKIHNGGTARFETSDYRPKELRNKTLEELVEFCNHDINKVLDLKLSLRHKFTLCMMIEPTLGLKQIKNEYQKPLWLAARSRQNRQRF